MRIALNGKKAQYDRLSLLGKLAEYGQELTAEATAPFRVSWSQHTKQACVTLGNTRVAKIVTHPAPHLIVRTGVPAVALPFIERAVRNAVAVTDEVGRMEREEKRSKKGGGMFTNTRGEPIRIMGWSTEDLQKATLGMTARQLGIAPRWGKRDFTLKYRYGGLRRASFHDFAATLSSASYSFAQDGEGWLQGRGTYSPYHFKKEAFLSELDTGLRIWEERMDPDRLSRSCQDLLRAPDLDVHTLDELRDEHRKAQNEDLDLTQEFRSGPLSMDSSGSFRFRGILIGFHEGEKDVLCCPALLNGQVVGAMRKAALCVRAMTYGLDPKDVKPLDNAQIERLVEETDVGYS